MRTITWVPGENSNLDRLFDELREQQYQDRSHRLWKNYSKENFNSAVALTIHFDNNDNPEVCASISSRDCWPAGAYRILNRLWKCSNRTDFAKQLSVGVGSTAQSQVNWIQAVPDLKLYFVSRQTENWESWLSSNLQRFNLQFQTAKHKYLTCPNECDDTCWQRIIYSGNAEVLDQWKHR